MVPKPPNHQRQCIDGVFGGNKFIAQSLHYSDQKEGSGLESRSFVDELLSRNVRICEYLSKYSQVDVS